MGLYDMLKDQVGTIFLMYMAWNILQHEALEGMNEKNYSYKREMKNTKLFHKMANAHRKRNCLAKNKVNGETLFEDANIKDWVAKHFS